MIETRRRAVVVGTGLVGSVLLGMALTRTPGSGAFTALTLAVALTWLVGGLSSGPLALGSRRVVGPVLLAVAAFAVFTVLALVVPLLPVLGPALSDVLARADTGSAGVLLALALLTGAAEEVYFRGALWRALPEGRQVAGTSLAYVLATAATGNVALVGAALVMGPLFALQRRASHGILAPTVTHLTWTVLMIALLPR